MEKILKNINYRLDRMIEYQKKNNIVGQCVSNSIYLHDFLEYFGVEHEIIIGYALFVDKMNKKRCIIDTNGYDIKEKGDIPHLLVHTWIKIDDYVFEPSYEIKRIEKVKYIETFKELIEIEGIKKYIAPHILKEALKKQISLQKTVNEYLSNPNLVNEYYKKLIKYINL